jgi:hypothetical protein
VLDFVHKKINKSPQFSGVQEDLKWYAAGRVAIQITPGMPRTQITPVKSPRLLMKENPLAIRYSVLPTWQVDVFEPYP